MNQNYETQSFCRTCMSTAIASLNVVDNQMAIALRECVSIQIPEPPTMTMICTECQRLINEFYSFKQRCEEINRALDQAVVGKSQATCVKVERDESEMKDDVREDRYKCTYCNHCNKLDVKLDAKITNETNDLRVTNDLPRVTRRVKRKKPTKKSVKCDLCGKMVSRKACDKHIKHCRRKIIDCENENDNKIDFDYLNPEIKMNESDSDSDQPLNDYTHPKKCPRCSEVCANKLTLKQHLKTHITITECPVCSKQFEKLSPLTAHIQTKHPGTEPSVKCDKCHEQFYVQLQLDKHGAKKHSPKTCPHCGKQISVRNLNRHIEMVHSGPRDKLQCDKCQRFFKHDLTLKMHVKYAHEDKPKICTVCGLKVFHMNKHMRRYHSGQVIKTVYTCRFCREQFDSMPMLRKHQNATHQEERENEERKFECKLCGKMFLNGSNLLCHRNSFHNTQLRFECSVCNKRFKRKQLVKSHMRSHTDERPYACDVCDKRFRHNSTMLTHRRTHTGERPYACAVCKKTFAQNCVLRTHMKTHLNHAPLFISQASATDALVLSEAANFLVI